nr:hypothetical protein Itr_chr06CG12290 [Ipomoea trifida]GMD35946.1 hypothetical protein Iba_chr09dCG11730 [Ipomoea batatas]
MREVPCQPPGSSTKAKRISFIGLHMLLTLLHDPWSPFKTVGYPKCQITSIAFIIIFPTQQPVRETCRSVEVYGSLRWRHERERENLGGDSAGSGGTSALHLRLFVKGSIQTAV